MTNLFLYKSESNNEIIGDVIVDLDAFLGVSAYKQNDDLVDLFVCALDIGGETYRSIFKSEASLKKAIKNIISAMNFGNTGLVEKMILFEEKNLRKKHMLTSYKEAENLLNENKEAVYKKKE